MFASRRLKQRDYSAPGLYFVTVCSDFKHCTFGRVVEKELELSPLGRIVEEAWLALSRRISGIRLHAHVVMPNHIHGIVEIVQQERAQQPAPLQRAAGSGQGYRRTPSLSIIVRSFKADVTRRAGVELEWKKEIWQHNYFDRVIRDDKEFTNASRYIAENPIRWQIQGQRMKASHEAGRAQQAAPLQRDRA
jgi:putative transposase